MKHAIISVAIFLAAVFYGAVPVAAQTTEFTYQGRLADGGQTANGNFDFEFKLFDAETGGTEIATLQRLNVAVASGIFSVKLDFGANFNGQSRFLEIGARRSGTQDTFSVLTPRQPFTSTPYAIKSLEATTATNAAQLGGVEANQFVVTTDPRMTDERPPAPNSPNYINNATTQQTSSNFNISGDGRLGGTLTAGIVNAETQFNLGGSRVFSIGGDRNTIAGIRAGEVNTGSANSFFGGFAGLSNTAGQENSFFGSRAGVSNTTGSSNSYFGIFAGSNNSTGSENSIFGARAGAFNTSGSRNTFVGSGAGVQSTGSGNSFFGFSTGGFVFNGDNNTSVGFNALVNTAVNGSVSSSTVIGANARVISAVPISFAAAIGAGAEVRTSNTVVLGRNLDTVQIPGTLNVAGGTNFGETLSANRINALTDFAIGGSTIFKTLGNSSIFVGIDAGGTNSTGPNNVFVGHRAGVANTVGTANSFLGHRAGNANTTGSFNTFAGSFAGSSNTVGLFNAFFGANAGLSNVDGDNNTFLGSEAGRSNTSGDFNVFSGQLAGGGNLTGSRNVFTGFAAGLNNTTGENNVFLGLDAGFTNTSGSSNTTIGSNSDVASANLTFATAVGAGAVVASSNTVVLGRFEDSVVVPGFSVIQRLGGQGIQNLCRNSLNQISACSSSLRYKTDIAPFSSGLNLVNRLRPITFNWKEGGVKDFGLGAEDVAAVEPLLVNYNSQGEVEGVKYDRLGVVLLNAVKEQQAQIEKQNEQIREQSDEIKAQRAVIEDLKQIVCQTNRAAKICK